MWDACIFERATPTARRRNPSSRLFLYLHHSLYRFSEPFPSPKLWTSSMNSPFSTTYFFLSNDSQIMTSFGVRQTCDFYVMRYGNFYKYAQPMEHVGKPDLPYTEYILNRLPPCTILHLYNHISPNTTISHDGYVPLDIIKSSTLLDQIYQSAESPQHHSNYCFI